MGRKMKDEAFRFWASRIWVDRSGRYIRGVDVFDAIRNFEAKYGERALGLRIL